MLGYPRTVLTPEGVPISKVRQWRYGFYFQDDWNVNQKLTLNLGVRYDLYGLPVERNGVTRTLRFDVPDAAPSEKLNRILWGQVRGWKTPYPQVKRGMFTPLSAELEDDDREEAEDR